MVLLFICPSRKGQVKFYRVKRTQRICTVQVYLSIRCPTFLYTSCHFSSTLWLLLIFFFPEFLHSFYVRFADSYTFRACMCVCRFSRVELGEEFNSSYMLEEKPSMFTHSSHNVGMVIAWDSWMCVQIHDFVNKRWKILIMMTFFEKFLL